MSILSLKPGFWDENCDFRPKNALFSLKMGFSNKKKQKLRVFGGKIEKISDWYLKNEI